MFPDDIGPLSQPRRANLNFAGRSGLDPRQLPLHSNAKSRLIAAYLSMYQQITHGGLYIDGFAGPQKRHFQEAWTARRVLELEPKWLSQFWLCELEPTGLEALRALKAKHDRMPRTRRVSVMAGDFNKTIPMILKSQRLRRNTPVFCLLDQRNTECHWSSVRAIAARAGRNKIELLYFLGSSWMHRSLKGSANPTRLREIDLWWGGAEWRELLQLSQVEVVRLMADRFAAELGYHFVTPYPVFATEKGKKTVFYLIHASDHPEAPKLMNRAYRKIVGDIAGTPADSQRSFL
jgi:three-Cys-motif partner protein